MDRRPFVSIIVTTFNRKALLKETIEKEFSTESQAVRNYLYNQHAIFDRPIIEGVFKKALNNVSKDKLNGVKIELVYPKWSATPLYNVTITDDKKLVPVKWKKKLQTIQAAKDVPTSVESLETNLKTKIEPFLKPNFKIPDALTGNVKSIFELNSFSYVHF